MESHCCSFCHKALTPHQGISWHTLPCGHISCSNCDIEFNNNRLLCNSDGFQCLMCFKEGKPGLSLKSPAADSYQPFLKQSPSNPQQQQTTLDNPFLNFQHKLFFDDKLNSIPTFVPRDPHLVFPEYNPTSDLKTSLSSLDMGSPRTSLLTDSMQFKSSYGSPKDEGFFLERNLNAARVDLKARVTDVFGQIMHALFAHQQTINSALDEKFANIGKKLINIRDKDTDIHLDVSAEVYKVTEEINAKLAEAKLVIEVINNLENPKTLSAFFDYLNSGGVPGNATEDLTPVIDTTLSKPMIRSWSNSTSQSAVLITWTTPRDFELLHRSEGFWYELEQRVADEPESAWHNVYKGVERTFVSKNMKKGKKYLFRCCVCVARHRYSQWSPEVLIVPGTGLPEGKHNLVTPEISKAIEQEVAKNFTSGAINAVGSSGPAVVTTVIVPINNNGSNGNGSGLMSPLSCSSPTLPLGDPDSISPATISPSPQSSSPGTTSITTITTDPAEAASTIVSASSSAAAVAAAMSAQGGCISGVTSPLVGSPPSFVPGMDNDPVKGGKKRASFMSWNSFTPGPYYELIQSNKVVTALQPGAIVLGHVFPKNCTTVLSVRILRGSGIFIGVAPTNISQGVIRQHLYNGWFLDTTTLCIGSHPPYKWKPKPAYSKGDLHKQNSSVYFPHEGDIITLNFNSKTNCLRFSTVPGIYLPGKYTSISPPGVRLSLAPAVVLTNIGDSVLFHSSTVQDSV